VGPLLAVLLVFATAEVARRIFDDDRTTLLAAALSTVCAVLRYHTADTMSHGLAALLLAAVVCAVLRASPRSYAVAGLAAGLLFATRPASGLVAFALVAFEGRRAPRQLMAAILGASGPCALFFLHQRASTGNAFTSTQLAYYALADGPPGCFRYGFGPEVGCRFEHGDFVAARLPHGFGPLEALLTTLRRLKMHLADAGNLELYAPLVVFAAARALRDDRARLAGAAFFGVVAAYVPFYFDGNYPGGGARFFADALPLEHVLLASMLVRLRVARVAVPLSLAGFALHTSFDHRALALREGGLPMFEPRVLASQGISRGLVLVGTDHGFNLGHAPGERDASRGVVVARNRGDAHDLLLWEALGRPQAFDYVFSAMGALVTPRAFPLRDAPFRFEAEAEWPPLVVTGGSAFPDFPACASARRALALRPAHGSAMRARLEVTAPRATRYRIGTGWVAPRGACRDVNVTVRGVSWTPAVEDSKDLPCRAVDGPVVELAMGQNFVDISVASECWLDFVELRSEGGPSAPLRPGSPP
jgi:hypothetical protein